MPYKVVKVDIFIFSLLLSELSSQIAHIGSNYIPLIGGGDKVCGRSTNSSIGFWFGLLNMII